MSRALLLFYAAECALKAALMGDRSLTSTDQLEDRSGSGASGKGYGHDLRNLAKALGMSNEPFLVDGFALQASGHGERNSISTSELHEAWRYGRRLESRAQQDAVTMLEGLLRWCERRN